MKRKDTSTIVIVTGRNILRADFRDGLCQWKSASRQAGSSVNEGFSAAMALGGEGVGRLWLLSDEWFSQTIQLNPAQVAGLNEAQMTRALAFEAEPFSGIPMAGAALAFRKTGEGSFDVVAVPVEIRDRLLGTAAAKGAVLEGIARADVPPEDEESLRKWLYDWCERLKTAGVAVIGAPAAPPSPKRFQTAAVLMAIAAVLLLVAGKWWITSETRELRKRNAEFASAANELSTVNKAVQEATAKIDATRSEIESVNTVAARRLSVPALLNGIAVQHMKDMVLRKIETEGPSSSVLHGMSLTSDAVDELGIVLKQTLRGSGWAVFPRKKTGLKKLANGGPWEFSLSIIHQEAASEGVNLDTTNDN